MSESTANMIMPIAYGNEEETGLLVGIGVPPRQQPYAIAAELGRFIPETVASCMANFGRYYLQNGALIYPDGSFDERERDLVTNDNIERATPETRTARDASKYIEASEQLIVEIAKNYTISVANNSKKDAHARIQRRVRDSQGNTKGAHDSYGFWTNADVKAVLTDSNASRSFLAFIATRSFMTGAGLVTPKGTYFSQKSNSIKHIEGRGYFNSMYRFVPELDGTGPRLEVRCNDVNISPWANQIRLGGMALMLGALSVPEVAQQLSAKSRVLRAGPQYNAKHFNAVYLDQEGEIIATPSHYFAVDYHEYVIDTILNRVGLDLDFDSEGYAIACEIKQYCEDYRACLRGEKRLAILGDRSDFAAKFSYIRRKLERDRSYGIERTWTDIDAQAGDLHYDNISISSTPDMTTVRYGAGYKLRNSGAFKGGFTQAEVADAMHNPPANTRANVRGTAIKQYDLSDCGWNYVKFRLPLGHHFHFDNVLDSEISPFLKQIGSAQPREPKT